METQEELYREDFNLDRWTYKEHWFDQAVTDMRKVIGEDRVLSDDQKYELIRGFDPVRKAMRDVHMAYIRMCDEMIRESKGGDDE